ncbi:MAG: hypothetical protein WCX15_01415 [Bacilli bacterium]|jgi:hypothetical protein|nr:hypothetical protein [Mollicutes bacterium]
MELAILIFIGIYVVVYRKNKGQNVYKFIADQAAMVYNKYAPYSYKIVKEKAKELKQEYTIRQYGMQVLLISGGALAISWLYFYDIIISLIYCGVATMFIPYIAYLRYKKIYSEFIFEQIQVYTTNTIMEFAVTESFVKALEGVYSSGVLEDPVSTDVKYMIDLAYQNGSIDEALDYMNKKYDYYMVHNMHQLFLQVTKEGSKSAAKDSLDSMLLDIDTLVEGVYSDRMERNSFHKSFLQYGIMLYLLVMLIQYLLGVDTYLSLIENMWIVKIILHAIIICNTYFLLNGEKYYNENVGAE